MKSIQQCLDEINENLYNVQGFHLGMSCMYAQTENSYTFTASCYHDSLDKVFILAKYHDYKIELIRCLTFLITIRTYKIEHKESFLLVLKDVCFVFLIRGK